MKIRHAVITVAGAGIRLFPVTMAIPKSMLPIVSSDGTVMPLVQHLVEEALNAGVDRVLLVTSPANDDIFRMHFEGRLHPMLLQKSRSMETLQVSIDRIRKISERVDFICQPEQKGLGHAIYMANEWVGREPFLIILGDHIHRSWSENNCLSQLLSGMTSYHTGVLGVFRGDIDPYSHRGYAVLAPYPNRDRSFMVKDIVYHPDPETAGEILADEILEPGHYWCLFGACVVSFRIFDILEKMIAQHLDRMGEIELAYALDTQLRVEGLDAVELDGESIEIGTPYHYSQAFDVLIS